MPSRPETDSPSADYAAALLADLGAPPLAGPVEAEEHPAVAWANSGAMALTGAADSPPLVAPVFLPAVMRGAVLALESISGASLDALGDPAALLGERAACAGLSRQGRISPGGACRFIRAEDGWVAVNLPRPDDFDLLPALIEDEADDGWAALERAAPRFTAAELVERGRLLGLALAREGEVEAGAWFEIETIARSPGPARPGAPLVLDFSSLWAGPLCGQALSLLGAQVVKVESASRPDGARGGSPAFFDLMNGGKACAAVDFRTAEGRDRLRRLIARADIVIDSARPRAWIQLGLEPAEAIAANPRLTWLSLTGHGRGDPEGRWPGFGDDAAAAAGASLLVARQGGVPAFVADALGDPLTGLHGALAAWAAHLAGGGRLVSLALSRVTAHALAFRRADDPVERAAEWSAWLAEQGIAARPPAARGLRQAARGLGADNAAVFALLQAPC